MGDIEAKTFHTGLEAALAKAIAELKRRSGKSYTVKQRYFSDGAATSLNEVDLHDERGHVMHMHFAEGWKEGTFIKPSKAQYLRHEDMADKRPSGVYRK